MSNELLEAVKEAKQNYINRDVNENGMDERDAMNIGFFMQRCINLLEQSTEEQVFFRKGITTMCKDLRVDFNKLEKCVKALEQAKTFFPITEGKHRALLNNCVDNDEAILRKREIACPKDFTEKVMDKINNEGGK